jgi:hypothetical protein
MSLVRRIEIGGMLGLVAAGLALAVAGTVAAALGAELPRGLAGALASAGEILGWARWVVVAALVYGVVKIRENV